MTEKQKKMSMKEIEKSVYGPDGLFSRVIDRINELGMQETMRLTGKRRQQIDIIKRQFRDSEKYDRPKVSTIFELAVILGVE